MLTRMTRLGASRVLLAAAVAVAAAALAASCFVAGFELGESAVAAGGASPDGGDGGPSGGQSAGCAHVLPPRSPAEPDPGPDSVDLVAAVRAIDFGEDDLSNGPTIGYDLDEHCTCQGQDDSCVEPDWATADHCDGPEGRDNAAAQLFDRINLFAPDLNSVTQSESAEAGGWSLLIRVREYNGLANDDQVSLAIYPSPGLDKDPCLGVDPVPAWDGSDRWPVSADALNGWGGTGGAGSGGGGTGGAVCTDAGAPWDVDDPRYADHNAYVTDWTVVANLPEAGIVLASSSAVAPLRIVAGFVTARIEQQGSGWALREGVFAGRWGIRDFFTTLAAIEQGGIRLCTDHPLYDPIKTAVCEYPDITAGLPGPAVPCDAISFAMGLEAEPAQLGVPWPSPATPSTCPPGTDPAEDECGP